MQKESAMNGVLSVTDWQHGCSRFRILCFKPQNFHPLSLALLFALISATLLSSGCATVGPNFEKPSAPVARTWIDQEDPKVKSEPADLSKWWTVFNDPTLDALIERAYTQNPGLQIAGLRILEARAQLGIAIGNQFPQQQALQAASAYNRGSKNAANTVPTADFSYSTYSAAFDAAWELDFWGRFRRAVESADASLAASVADYDDALVTLTGDVASTYVLIRTYEERLQVARENVEIQKRSLELTEARYRNGAVTELDVQQARSLLYDTEAQIPVLETGLRQAKNALSTLLGMPPGDLQELLGPTRPIPAAPAEVAIGIPAELLRRRPDIRSAEFQAAAQSAQIGVAMADLFPRISLLGNFGFLTSDSPLTARGGSDASNLFDWSSFTMSTGPSIQWPILNYGRITNNVRLQDARFQELLVNYRNTVLNAAREAEDALVAFLQAQEEVDRLTESVAAAKRAVDLSYIQYLEGATDYTRVLNSQQVLVQQQDRLTQARGSVPTNLIALYKALGGGWEARVGKEFVSKENIEAMQKRRIISPPP